MKERQANILHAIVEAYARTAEPVSSLQLSRQFGLSPATIRAEMTELEHLNFISQPHTSAGRIPTDKGYRQYVNSLAESNSDNRINQALARRVSSAGEIDRAIKTAAESLAQVTQNVGLATLPGQLYYTGLASLFGQPEFLDGRQAFEAARLLDNLSEWLNEAALNSPVSVYIGRENPIGKSSGCSLIIARFSSPYSDHSYIGVLGPTRQNYGQSIGLVQYAGRLLEESLS